MNLEKWSIKDAHFSHAYSTSNWFKPTYFEWDFNNVLNDFIFFTDSHVNTVNNLEYKHLKKYAWLIESPAVTREAYNFVMLNHHLFDKIFTHSESILQFPNSYIVPIGGCHLDEEEIKLDYEKTKLISMMYSDKNFAPGHSIRHNIAKMYGNSIDVMGSGTGTGRVKKIHSVKDYAFSVVVENIKEGYYFTEKIIDCFLSGCIPIYYGSKYIQNFFNSNGFLIFDTYEELEKIINNQEYLINFYNSHHEEIKENFNLALKHKIGEDFLYTKYKDTL
jgi:hypothetical protein